MKLTFLLKVTDCMTRCPSSGHSNGHRLLFKHTTQGKWQEVAGSDFFLLKTKQRIGLWTIWPIVSLLLALFIYFRTLVITVVTSISPISRNIAHFPFPKTPLHIHSSLSFPFFFSMLLSPSFSPQHNCSSCPVLSCPVFQLIHPVIHTGR